MDDSNLASATNTKKANTNPNISIRIPDVISNSTSKSKGYFKLEDDASDDELDTRKSNNNRFVGTSVGQSLQMQQEVGFLFILYQIALLAINFLVSFLF